VAQIKTKTTVGVIYIRYKMKTKEEIRLLDRLKTLDGRVRFKHYELEGGINGRKTTYATLLIKKKYYTAYACLSKNDQFNKNIGRTIALGRAFKMFEKGKDTNPSTITRFKDDGLKEK